MTHLDRDTLALVALAELDLSAAEHDHLAACPGCTGELDALRRTVLIGRSAGSVELVAPADAVWGRIHAALGLSDTLAAPPRLADIADDAAVTDAAVTDAGFAPEASTDTELATDAGAPDAGFATDAGVPDARPATDAPAPDARFAPDAPAPQSRPATAAPNAPATPAPNAPATPATPATHQEPRPPASIVSRHRHRRRRAWLPVAAAACAVGVIGGIVAGAWWQSNRAPAADTVLAQARLDALPGWAASGSAAVEESADGHRSVVVDLAADDDADADADALREVWLLTADASGLVSVGLLDGTTGRFSIPDGIDLAEYPVVDVSAEPADGNPAHSGDSIVRGTLTDL